MTTHLRLMEKALIEGIDPDDLVLAAPERFGITPEQANADLLVVYQRLAASGARIRAHHDEDVMLAISHRRRNKLWRDAMAEGQARVALDTEKDHCKLLGIYPADRIGTADETTGQEEHEQLDSTLALLMGLASSLPQNEVADALDEFRLTRGRESVAG